MSLSGIKTLPLLRGTLASIASWQGLLGRANLRVYPFQLGCKVRAAGTTSPISTSGMGELSSSVYAIACTATSYGNTSLYIPNMNKIFFLTGIGTADDEIYTATPPSVGLGDYILNIGADGAASPTISPNFDGTTLLLYDDNTGQIAHATKYFLTGSNGQFEGWMGPGTLACDLLITDTDNNPIVVIPFVPTGRQIL